MKSFGDSLSPWRSPAVRAAAYAVFLGALVWAIPGTAQPEPEESLDPTATAPAPTEPAASPTPGEAPERSSGQRTLLDTLYDGGIIGGIIILLSFVSVAFVIEHALTIRKSRIMPEYAMQQLEELIAANKLAEAIEFCQREENDSLAVECVLAGLERFQSSQFGFAEYKSAVEEEGENQTSRLYRKTEALAVIGVIAPMLGLLGTVSGMIGAFNTLASKGGAAKPAELAGNIGEALVTTFEGLVVAIPTMIFCSYFRNKIDSLVAEAGKRVERILTPLSLRR